MHGDRSTHCARVGGDALKLRMKPALCERLVPALNHAFGVTLTDRGGVRIHGVQQNLDVCGMTALQISIKIVRYRQTGVEFTPRQMWLR